MQPEFIIAGVQKSATSYLHLCIKEHPDIWMPDEESSAYESPDYENGELDKLLLTLKQAGGRLSGIKRPTYLYSNTICERIARHNPDTKIIIVLRNPLERTISAYYHYMLSGFLPMMQIEAGLLSILEGKMDKEWKRAGELIKYSLYAQPVDTYINKFGKNNIKILLYEDIRSSAESVLKDLFEFLAVNNDFVPENINERPQKVVYSSLRIKLLSTRNRFQYVYNNDKTRLFPVKKNATGKVYCALINAMDQVLGHMLSERKPILSDSLCSRLADTYLDDICQLEEGIKRDLSAWKKCLSV